jgi:hypothetical protein
LIESPPGGADPTGADPTGADLVAIPGVSGMWRYSGSDRLVPRRLANTAGLVTTVFYLDDDPPTVAGRMAAALRERWANGVTPLFAAPLAAVVPPAWDRVLPQPAAQAVSRPVTPER